MSVSTIIHFILSLLITFATKFVDNIRYYDKIIRLSGRCGFRLVRGFLVLRDAVPFRPLSSTLVAPLRAIQSAGTRRYNNVQYGE